MTPAGHLEVTVGSGRATPASALARISPATSREVDTIVEGIQKGEGLIVHPDTDRYLLAAVALGLTHLPSPIYELSIRYGLAPRVDVGLQFTGTTWRGDAFFQLFESQSWHLAVGAGFGYRTFDQTVIGLLSDLHVLSVSEMDADLVVLAGREWAYGSFYGGPKVVLSSYLARGAIATAHDSRFQVLGAEINVDIPPTLDLSQSWLVGGVLGGRLGYQHIWVTGELGIYQSFYKPKVLGNQIDLSGFFLYPIVGLVMTF